MATINLREPVYLNIQNLISRPLTLFDKVCAAGAIVLVPVRLEDPQDGSWDRLVTALRNGTAKVGYPGVGGLAELIVKAALSDLHVGTSGLLFNALVSSAVSNTTAETTFDSGQYLVDPAVWTVGNILRVSASGKVVTATDTQPTLRLRFRYGPATTLSGQTGSSANLIAGASTGRMRVSGLTGMSVASVGRRLKLSATGSSNDGSFAIAAYVSATSVDVYVTGTAGTVPDASNGTIDWSEQQNNLLADSTPMTLLPSLPGTGVFSGWNLQVELVCRQIGATGVLMTTGTVSAPGAGVAGAIMQHGLVTLDLNAQRLLYATAEFDTAGADNIATLESMTVELLSGPSGI